MPDHRTIVARGFRLAGLAIGAPSLLAATGLGVAAFTAASGATPPQSQPLDVSTYGLAGLLSNAAQGIAGVLAVFNGLAAWMFGLLAVLALAVALFGGLLWLVGRGLTASAAWARVVGLILAGLAVLNGLSFVAFAEGPFRLVPAACLAAGLYAFWALGWRYEARSR